MMRSVVNCSATKRLSNACLKQQHVRRFGAAAAEFPQYILNAPATEVSELGNGLRVASEGGHGETATVGVWIDAGSRNETEKNNGVAHFLEHMAFKGTSNRTKTQLEVEVENLGGHLNAYTSREQTVYYAKVFKQDIPKAMDILSDIIQNATFDPKAINAERDVILREMQEVEKEQEEVIFDRLHETAYHGSGLGRTILGPTENILSITQDDLRGFIQANYVAPRMVIAGAGAVEHQQLVDLSEKHFGSVPKTASVPSFTDAPNFVGSEIRIREDDLNLAHVAIAFEGAGWASPDAFPLMVMQSMLGCWSRTSGSGQNQSSRLCRQVAENNSAHSILTFHSCYKDTGLFGVYAVAEPTSLNDLAFYTLENMVRLCHRPTEEEVTRAKTQLKATMLSHLDGSSQICEDIGRQMLTYGRRLSPAEIFARIDAVDANTVKQTAKKYINDQDVAMSAIGPIYELPDYNWIRRRTYWHSM